MPRHADATQQQDEKRAAYADAAGAMLLCRAYEDSERILH